MSSVYEVLPPGPGGVRFVRPCHRRSLGELVLILTIMLGLMALAAIFWVIHLMAKAGQGIPPGHRFPDPDEAMQREIDRRHNADER